jgi:hypothetical protein
MHGGVFGLGLLAALACVAGCSLEPRYEPDAPERVAPNAVGRRDSATSGDAVRLGPLSDAAIAQEESVGGSEVPADGRDGGVSSPEGRSDGGACVSSIRLVPPEGAVHVPSSLTLEFLSNPPASGAHYGTGAPYRDYGDFVVPRGHWLHDVELGGVVLLYGPTADAATVEQLRAVYADLPEDPECERNRTLLTMDPELDDAIAVVAWDYVLEASCVDADAIEQFVLGHRGKGREDRCNVDTF